MELSPGARLGPYEILGLLGRGGMGEVYRARDPRLGRDVAIKVLPDEFAHDWDRLRRFSQEARAAGILNHPNILDIHDVGSVEGAPYVVSELLEGTTLRDLLRDERLPVARAMEIAVQIGHGLAAAHEKGIVHCDLKPANLFLTTGGRVKILDFGLARCGGSGTDEAAGMSAAQTLTRAHPGTVGYMSPEQVRGRATDARSDIFSLGVVLYEMLGGLRAFHRESVAETQSAIIYDEPAPLSRINRRVPPALESLVKRCLAKAPDERFQSAHDLTFALQALASAPAAPGRRAALAEALRAGYQATRQAARRWRALVALAALAGAAFWLMPGPGGSPSSGMRPRQLTSDAAWEAEPALSADGTLVAYASNRSGNPDIWVIDARGGEPVQLTDDPAADRSPAWFPDGSAVAFVSERGAEPAVWKVPRLGGSAVLLLPDADEPSISPDGTRIAFARRGASVYARIAVANLGRPESARLLTGEKDGLWDHRQPAWSPDGRQLSYQDFRNLWVTSVAGGPPRRLTTDDANDSDPAWSADGRFIYFTSLREGTQALWRVPGEGGRPERVSLGTGPEAEPSLALRAGRMAYSTFRHGFNVGLLDLHSGARTRLPGMRAEGSPCFAPDGSAIVFDSDRESSPDLWLQPLVAGRPTGPPRRLTEQPGSEAVPAFSPDGRWVAYTNAFEGRRDVWVVPASGGLPRRVTSHPAVDMHPAWSPDSGRLAFVSDREGGEHVWVLGFREGTALGEPAQLTSGDGTDYFPAWSPDGSLVAFRRVRRDASEVWVVPSAGGGPARRVLAEGARYVRWAPTGDSLLVSVTPDSPGLALLRVSAATGRAEPVKLPVSLDDADPIGNFDVSRDQRYLAFTEEQLRGDIWLLEMERRPF